MSTASVLLEYAVMAEVRRFNHKFGLLFCQEEMAYRVRLTTVPDGEEVYVGEFEVECLRGPDGAIAC